MQDTFIEQLKAAAEQGHKAGLSIENAAYKRGYEQGRADLIEELKTILKTEIIA